MEYWRNALGFQYSTTPVLHCSNRALAMTTETTDTRLIEELKLISGIKLKVDEPLARYTSMKIGGPADYFIEAETAAGLAEVLPLLDKHQMPFCMLGNGSNVLVSDRGIRGTVVHLAGEFKRVKWNESGETVWGEIGAAAAVTQLAREAARKGYAGLEFAEGIPGSVGGALVMNAGAYGSEFERVVDAVDGVTRTGEVVHFGRRELTFTYRDSHVPAGTVVTSVRLRLRKAEAAQVSSKLRELVTKRKGSQPSGHPNSGSMFRNPAGDFAGRLIEAAGLKGRRIGQAQISERHANFIVNLGGAKAEDVRRLMDLARAEVQNQFGIELVAEVRLLGDWPPNA